MRDSRPATQHESAGRSTTAVRLASMTRFSFRNDHQVTCRTTTPRRRIDSADRRVHRSIRIYEPHEFRRCSRHPVCSGAARPGHLRGAGPQAGAQDASLRRAIRWRATSDRRCRTINATVRIPTTSACSIPFLQTRTVNLWCTLQAYVVVRAFPVCDSIADRQSIGMARAEKSERVGE